MVEKLARLKYMQKRGKVKPLLCGTKLKKQLNHHSIFSQYIFNPNSEFVRRRQGNISSFHFMYFF